MESVFLYLYIFPLSLNCLLNLFPIFSLSLLRFQVNKSEIDVENLKAKMAQEGHGNGIIERLEEEGRKLSSRKD